MKEYLEQSMVEWGKQRYRKAQRLYKETGMLSKSPAFKRLGREVHKDVVRVIQRFFDECAQPQACCPKWLPLIWELEPDVVAFLAIQATFDFIQEDISTAYASFEIAKALENEVRVRYFRKHVSKGDWMLLQREQKKADSKYRFIMEFWDRERALHSKGRYKRFTLWSESYKVHIGTWLLEIIRMNTNLFSIRDKATSKGRPMKKLCPNPKLFDWVDRYDKNCEILKPFWLALPTKPVPWTGNWGGGYDGEDLPLLPLMKKANDIENRDFSMLFEPVNKLQDVAWRLNRKVYEVMQWAWESDLSIGSMQKKDMLEPLEPVENLKQKDEFEFRTWKRRAKAIFEYNRRTSSQRLRSLRILLVCKEYAKMDKFYFPYTLDYRGRVYSVPSFVCPQACDFGRSVLEFANGVPITNDEEAKWLLIHGANVHGEKGTYEERIKWVRDHEEEILNVANNWMEDDTWHDASEPWAYLAFCFEYAQFKEEGFGFITHLPCQMDASCNGVQILSLLLKDEKIGALTNLIPGKEPQDLYQEIADVVTRKFHVSKSKNSLAGDWLRWGITRKYTKQIVMCKPFGMNSYTSVEAVEDVFKKEVERGRVNPFSKEDYIEAFLFLSTCINRSTDEVLSRHVKFMRWLKQEVRKCNDTFKWTTPFGLEIHQHIQKVRRVAIKSVLGMQTTTINYNENVKGVDKTRMGKAIVPNYIHSIDASVVHFLACKFDGDVSSIHDCFATQSPLAPKMHQQLTEIYQEIFNSDITERFKGEVAKQTGTDVLADDSFDEGTLDVSVLKDCQYIFS